MIGNGFDIHLGLATSYQEFLQYYLKQSMPDIGEVGKRYIKRLNDDLRVNLSRYIEEQDKNTIYH